MLYPSSPHCCDFYPRSPCGERRAANSSSGKSITISIHALLAESDPVDIRTFQTLKIFLSTLSLRRATLHFLAVVRAFRISIHALLAESDAVTTVVVDPSRDFYPRSPCGERLKTPPQGSRSRIFLSTLSLRRATSPAMQILTSRLEFLSTLSLRRATHPLAILSNSHTDFYPRSPCGERRVEWRNKPQVSAISIHALLAESDILSSQCHPNI